MVLHNDITTTIDKYVSLNLIYIYNIYVYINNSSLTWILIERKYLISSFAYVRTENNKVNSDIKS